MTSSSWSSWKQVAFVLLACLTSRRNGVVQAQDVCTPCWGGEVPEDLEPLGPDDLQYNCTSAIERAAKEINGTDACLAIQLGTYQGSCCISPPPDYCTLCPDGATTFNAEKAIPPGKDNSNINTCANVADRNLFIRDVEVYESCPDTDRLRASAWCECEGVEPGCTLLCDDGNPPPDTTKETPVFGQSCQRYVFEYTALPNDKCAQRAATNLLNFDAKAFCCNEDPPENCEICGPGQILGDAAKVLQSEFYGEVTCGEIADHAQYLPGGECKRFINELLDIPFGANEQCCVDSSAPKALFGFAAISTALVFALNMFFV